MWLHFTRMSSYAEGDMPVIVRGSGQYVYDDRGKRYLDGLSGLFVSQIGHGRAEVAEAGARQAAELAYFPLWSYAHPRAIELAERLAALAPGDLNRAFFTTSGSEAVESAWKLAKQYFKTIGQPGRYKVLSREIAYHGTSMGALAITGLPGIKEPFEPMAPGGVRVPNTNFYRAPDFVSGDLEGFGRWAADEIGRAIEREGPESVAAVFLEPVQNSGGCFPPPPGYFARVREICDRHGVLLVSDEVICAFGRLGYYFGSQRYGYQPDIITFAKGVTSGYSPLGGMMVSDALMEPFGSSHEDISGFESPRHVGHTGGPGAAAPPRSCTGSPSPGTPCQPRSPWPTWTCSRRRTCSATSAATRRRSGPRWRSSATCPSSATSAATGTSTGSSWSRTRPPGRRSPTTSPNGCCAASSPPRCTTPA